MSNTFYSPDGNAEMWDKKPKGYFTPEEWAAAHPEPTPEPYVPTPEEAAMFAQAEASAILTKKAHKQLAQTETFSAAELATLAKAGLYDPWAAGAKYVKGNRIAHNGVVYEVQQAVTAQAHQAPDSAGMLAIYRPISASGDTADGSRDKPYAYLNGMDVSTGKYYSFEGKLYLAKSDMKPCVWNPGTAGMWQWELVG